MNWLNYTLLGLLLLSLGVVASDKLDRVHFNFSYNEPSIEEIAMGETVRVAADPGIPLQEVAPPKPKHHAKKCENCDANGVYVPPVKPEVPHE